MSLAERLPSTELTDNVVRSDLEQQLALTTQQPPPNVTIEQVVEAALLEDAVVDECVVLIRETATSGSELVAYVVTSGVFSWERLQSHLQAVLPAAWVPSAYVPVSSLPLTSTGQVDKHALASLEVIDSDLVQRWEERLRSLPLLEQVAVVVQEHFESIPPLHLSDLLPDWKATARRIVEESVPAAISPGVKPEDLKPKVLAISDGGSLTLEKDSPTTLPEALQRAVLQGLGKSIFYLQPDGSEIVQSYSVFLQEVQRILAGLRELD